MFDTVKIVSVCCTYVSERMILLERVMLSVVLAGFSGVDSSIIYLSSQGRDSQKAFGIYNSMGMAGLLAAAARILCKPAEEGIKRSLSPSVFDSSRAFIRNPSDHYRIPEPASIQPLRFGRYHDRIPLYRGDHTWSVWRLLVCCHEKDRDTLFPYTILRFGRYFLYDTGF